MPDPPVPMPVRINRRHRPGSTAAEVASVAETRSTCQDRHHFCRRDDIPSAQGMALRMTGPYHPRTMRITCAACGQENREGRRFCAECGAALTPVCPACGASNEVGEKFCGDCGAALSPTPSAGGSSPAPTAGPAEKKHITVLFADVAGSMDLQEQLDAEVWAEIMGRFVALLAEGSPEVRRDRRQVHR